MLALNAGTELDLRATNLVGVGAKRHTEGSGQTEISQLEVALLVNKQVLGLQVAVEDAVGVAVADTGAKLVHELLDHGLAESHVSCATVHAALGQRLATTSL